MVIFPDLRRQNETSGLTVASLDARHRVQRRSLMMALEPMIRAVQPGDASREHLVEQLLLEAHLEQTASLRACFYRLREDQFREREALIELLSQPKD
jgi:hypothetical protein